MTLADSVKTFTDNQADTENQTDSPTTTALISMLKLLQTTIEQHQLPLILSLVNIDSEPTAKNLGQYKFTQKYYRKLSEAYDTPVLIIDDKCTLLLLIEGIAVMPDWASIQRRIVNSGRKSELLLQATKINTQQKVLDATAGFGHDSLIIASRGAQVTMLERDPLLALLLLVEKSIMEQQQNWQKLMSRLTIKHCAAEAYLTNITNEPDANEYDVIYLDPMFPEDSYSSQKTGKGAKVGKHMQALHSLVKPPSNDDEKRLFNLAKQALSKNNTLLIDGFANSEDELDILRATAQAKRRLIIKRPVSAPYFANQAPDDVWKNDAIRFDGYFI